MSEEVVLTDRYRKAREARIQEGIRQGEPWDVLVRTVAEEFNALDALVWEDVYRVASSSRTRVDDDRLHDLRMEALLDATFRVAQAEAQTAALTLGNPNAYTPAELLFILKCKANAAKNALAAADVHARLAARRSERWSDKVKVTHGVEGETPQEKASVLRLLGMRVEADALVEKTRVLLDAEEAG